MMTPALTNDDLLRPPTHGDGHGSYLIFNSSSSTAHQCLMGAPGPATAAAAAADDDDRGHKPARNRGNEDREEVSGPHPAGWLQLGLGVGGCRSSSAAAAFSDPSSSRGRDPRGFFRRPIEPPGLFPAIMGVYGHRGPADDVARSSRAGVSAARAAFAVPTVMPSSVSRMWQFISRPPAILSGPSSAGWLDGEVRVIGRPRRPQTGLWLVLQAAAQDQQVKELFLPQISKSYLRIKDGRMTVRLLMKYLANRLGLLDESQVEIACRGQQLPPFLTLTSVRDNIWCSPEAAAELPQPEHSSTSSSAKHVMSLFYRRSRN